MILLPNHTLLITTLGRIGDMRRTFDDLKRCTTLPECLILILGNKNVTREFQQLCTDFREEIPGMRVLLRITQKDRILQLRTGLGLVARHGILHIIDDDLSPSSGYFSELDWHFQHHPECVAAGGFLEPASQKPTRISFWRRFFLLDSYRPGAYLSSGQTSGYQHRKEVAESTVTETDWLSGCSMSFRTELFEHITPDVQLRDDGFDEDVDLSRQAAQFGKLHVISAARCVHRLSNEGRKSAGDLLARKISHRWYLCKKHQPGVRYQVAFWWSCIGIGIAIHSHLKPDTDLISGFWNGIKAALSKRNNLATTN